MIMGVEGAGKTTIGHLLAASLHWTFVDADEFHPPANIEKMKRGIPLDDEDRRPWLEAVRSAIERWMAEKRNVVLACSALKRAYRDQLVVSPEVKLVYLKGPIDLIQSRIHERSNHFARESLLASQFSILEEPDDAILIDIGQPPAAIIADIRAQLGSANCRHPVD